MQYCDQCAVVMYLNVKCNEDRTREVTTFDIQCDHPDIKPATFGMKLSFSVNF